MSTSRSRQLDDRYEQVQMKSQRSNRDFSDETHSQKMNRMKTVGQFDRKEFIDEGEEQDVGHKSKFKRMQSARDGSDSNLPRVKKNPNFGGAGS